MEQATLTVKIIKDEGFAEQLVKGTLTEAQKEVVRFIARQAVEEYILRTKPALSDDKYDNPNRIIRLKEVVELTGLSRSTIYKRVNENTFPASIKLGPQSVGWRIREVLSWLESRHVSN